MIVQYVTAGTSYSRAVSLLYVMNREGIPVGNPVRGRAI